MKIIIVSKTSLTVQQIDSVTNIAKSGTTITVTYGTNSTKTVNTETDSIYIIES